MTSAGLDKPEEEEVVEAASDESSAEVKHLLFLLFAYIARLVIGFPNFGH